MADTLDIAIRSLLKSVLHEVAREVLPSLLLTMQEKPQQDIFQDCQLLRSREAAELLAISERHLHNLTSSGVIPDVRIGKSVRYSLQSLREWIQQSESMETQEASSESLHRKIARRRDA